TTTGLLLLSFGTYLALVLHFGSGIGERESLWVQIGQNLREAVTQPFFYAPWLAFAIPLLLCAIGWRESDRFARTAVGFAGLLAIVLFCLTNFQEVRAEIPVLLLLFPAALTGLRRVLPGEPPPQ